jgi:hypothetical protein
MPRNAVADRPVSMDPTLPSIAMPGNIATRALVLLAAGGTCVALFFRALRGARWVPASIARNEISPSSRDHLFAWAPGGAAIPVVPAAVALGAAWRT